MPINNPRIQIFCSLLPDQIRATVMRLCPVLLSLVTIPLVIGYSNQCEAIRLESFIIQALAILKDNHWLESSVSAITKVTIVREACQSRQASRCGWLWSGSSIESQLNIQ